ncbi:unnamed protein product [Dicrocoelium dendriticum]|nr:unnamed protein product [Dicrocoelium dendriticum]
MHMSSAYTVIHWLMRSTTHSTSSLRAVAFGTASSAVDNLNVAHSAGPESNRPVATTTSDAKYPGENRDVHLREIDGPSGPEPTRYGDWERNGRCSDF